MEYLFTDDKLKFKNCKDLTKNLVISAQTWVYNFFNNKYQLAVDDQDRIKSLFSDCTYELIKDSKDDYISCEYDTDNKIVTIYSQNDDFFNRSILLAFESIVHILIHVVSKSEDKINVIEEGYVSYIEKEVMKYALENNFSIKGIYDDEKQVLTKEDFRNINLKNRYVSECVFVQCFQAICLSKNMDSGYEYIFNKNGFDKVKELANKVSLELGQIVDMQQFKGISSFIGLMEEKILRDYLLLVPLEIITDVLLDDNIILMEVIRERLSKEEKSTSLLKVSYRNLPGYVFSGSNISFLKNIDEVRELLIRDIGAIDGMHVHKALVPLFNGISLSYTFFENIPEKVSFWKKYARQYERFIDVFDNYGLIHLDIICKVMQFDIVIENLVTKKDIDKRLNEFLKATKINDADTICLLKTKFFADLEEVRKEIINGRGINEIIKNLVMHELKNQLLFKVMIGNMHDEDINEYTQVVCARYNKGVSDYCVHSYGMVMDAMILIEEYLLKQQTDYLDVNFISSFISKVKQVFNYLNFSSEIINSFKFKDKVILCAIDLKNMGYDRLALLPEKFMLLLHHKYLDLSNSGLWNEVFLDIYYELFYEKINDTKRYYHFLVVLDKMLKSEVFINNLRNFSKKVDVNGKNVLMGNNFLEAIKKEVVEFSKILFLKEKNKFYDKILGLNDIVGMILEDGEFLSTVIKSECKDEKVIAEVLKIEEEKGIFLSASDFVTVLGVTNLGFTDGIKKAIDLYSDKYKDCIVIRKYIYCLIDKKIRNDYHFYKARESAASWLELSDLIGKITLLHESNEKELADLMTKLYLFRKPYIYAIRDSEKIGLLFAFEPLMYKLVAADRLGIPSLSIRDNLDLLKFICAVFEKGIPGVTKTQLNKISKVIDEMIEVLEIKDNSLLTQFSMMKSYLSSKKK